MPYGAPTAAETSPPFSFITNGNMRVCQTHSLANQNFDNSQQMLGADQQVFNNMPDCFGYQYTAALATNGPDAAVLFDHPILGANGLSWCLRRNGALATGGNNYLYAFTSIEGRNFSPLLGQQATLRFWIKQTNTGVFPIAILTNPAANGPVPVLASNTFLTSYTYTASGAWQEFEIPITFQATGIAYPVPFTSDLLCRIAWPLVLGAGVRVAPNLIGQWTTSPGVGGFGSTTDADAHQNANDTWQIADVRLQLGDGGDYPNTDFTEELQKCRRRYWQTFPYGTVPAQGGGTAGEPIRYIAQLAGVNSNGVHVRHPVQMRSAPTATFYAMTGAGTLWFNYTGGAPSGAASLGAPAAPSGVDSAIVINPQVAGDNAGDLIGLHASFDARI